jgi:transposase-like protein
VEGSTENATLVTDLIVGLRERGLDVTRPILAVLDGSKALRRAVLDVFDRPVIQRCQLHYADAVVGVDTHRDTHHIEIALPTGTRSPPALGSDRRRRRPPPRPTLSSDTTDRRTP